MKPAVFRRHEDRRTAIASDVSQYRLTDATTEIDRPHHPGLAVEFAERVELAVVAAEEHDHAAVASQVGSDHATDRAANIELPSQAAEFAGCPGLGGEAAEHAVRLGVQYFAPARVDR